MAIMDCSQFKVLGSDTAALKAKGTSIPKFHCMEASIDYICKGIVSAEKYFSGLNKCGALLQGLG